MTTRRTCPGRLVVLVLLAGLGGCARQYETFQPPPLEFGGPPLRFAVADVVIESAYQPRGAPPYVEHTLALTPEAAARALLERRLTAVGGPGRLQAVIVDATVIERPLDTKSGVSGYLTTEMAAIFEGRLKVRVDHLDAAGEITSTVSTAVTRTRGIPEDASYVDRQTIGYELVRDMVDDLDAALVANLEESSADILRR